MCSEAGDWKNGGMYIHKLCGEYICTIMNWEAVKNPKNPYNNIIITFYNN